MWRPFFVPTQLRIIPRGRGITFDSLIKWPVFLSLTKGLARTRIKLSLLVFRPLKVKAGYLSD